MMGHGTRVLPALAGPDRTLRGAAVRPRLGCAGTGMQADGPAAGGGEKAGSDACE